MDFCGNFDFGDEGADAGLGFVSGCDFFGFEGAHLCELGALLGKVSEVGPFVGVGVNVVEFFLAAVVVDVAPALVGDGVILRVIEMSDRGVGPRGRGIFE